MALSNEDRQEIERMIKRNQPQFDEESVRKILRKLIPEIFGKSLEQIRSYFISNIT
jgi:hypothetical protein